MRTPIVIGLLTATFLLGAGAPAAIAQGAWCLRANVGFGTSKEMCDFPNYQSCAAERPLWGSTAFCSPSQYARWTGGYGPGPGVYEPRRSGKKKRHRHR